MIIKNRKINERRKDKIKTKTNHNAKRKSFYQEKTGKTDEVLSRASRFKTRITNFLKVQFLRH